MNRRSYVAALLVCFTAMSACAASENQAKADDDTLLVDQNIPASDAQLFVEQEVQGPACDTRTDEYSVLMQVATAEGTIGLCQHNSEPQFDADGAYGDPVVLTVFPFKTTSSGDTVFKPASADVRLGAAIGAFEEESNQSSHKHWLWFQTASATHVFETCEGGYKLCSPYVSYVRIVNGRKEIDATCLGSENDCGEFPVDGSPYFREEYSDSAIHLVALLPALIDVRLLPEAMQPLLP